MNVAQEPRGEYPPEMSEPRSSRLMARLRAK
jgi:hypothetical protein